MTGAARPILDTQRAQRTYTVTAPDIAISVCTRAQDAAARSVPSETDPIEVHIVKGRGSLA